MAIHHFYVGQERRADEGLRILATRYPPRRMRKEDYLSVGKFDVWFPLLGPSAELLRQGPRSTDAERRWPQFVAKYKKEMRQTACRQAIQLLAEISVRMPISIGCYEHESAHCHRFILLELIAAAANAF